MLFRSSGAEKRPYGADVDEGRECPFAPHLAVSGFAPPGALTRHSHPRIMNRTPPRMSVLVTLALTVFVDLITAVAVGIILAYTFMGGYLAVAYTDFFQSLVMLVGVMWIVIAALSELGGLTAANTAIRELDPTLLSVWGKGLGFEGQWGVVAGAVYTRLRCLLVSQPSGPFH